MGKQAPAMTHRRMVDKWKRDPEFRKVYDELETEYALLRELLEARRKAGLSQAQVAGRMGVRPPAVTRLETSLAGARHSPTLNTLKRYARAVNCELAIQLRPRKRAAK